jgi:hypothetical protein
MKRLILGLTLAVATAVAASPATATMPNGNGHVTIPGLVCEGQEQGLIRVTRHLGASAWIVETEQHYVVSMFSVTVTFIPDNGDPSVVVESFTNTFGEKMGLEPILCEGTGSDAVPGGTLETVIRGEVRFVPAGT